MDPTRHPKGRSTDTRSTGSMNTAQSTRAERTGAGDGTPESGNMPISRPSSPRRINPDDTDGKRKSTRPSSGASVPKRVGKGVKRTKVSRHETGARKSTSTSQKYKIEHEGDMYDQHDDGDADGGDSDASASSCPKGPRQFLACPFYKYDNMQYMSCVRLRLTRVRDVKQHLSRCHRQPKYCPVCGDTFADTQSWDAHIQARDCVKPPGTVHVQGVTEEQSGALARRVSRNLDEPDQWFSVWKILFPTLSPPASPYLSNHFEETIDMVHDYWVRHGGALVDEVADRIQAESGAYHYKQAQRGHIIRLSSQVVGTLLTRVRTQSRARAGMDSSSSATTREPTEESSFIHRGTTSHSPEPSGLSRWLTEDFADLSHRLLSPAPAARQLASSIDGRDEGASESSQSFAEFPCPKSCFPAKVLHPKHENTWQYSRLGDTTEDPLSPQQPLPSLGMVMNDFAVLGPTLSPDWARLTNNTNGPWSENGMTPTSFSWADQCHLDS